MTRQGLCASRILDQTLDLWTMEARNYFRMLFSWAKDTRILKQSFVLFVNVDLPQRQHYFDNLTVELYLKQCLRLVTERRALMVMFH